VPERRNPHLISWFGSPQGKEISAPQIVQPDTIDHHTFMVREYRREFYLEVKEVGA
jgi:hypothetical protein